MQGSLARETRLGDQFRTQIRTQFQALSYKLRRSVRGFVIPSNSLIVQHRPVRGWPESQRARLRKYFETPFSELILNLEVPAISPMFPLNLPVGF